MIRCVQSQNPRWYQSFCALHISSRGRMRRKPDTKIKRRETLRALAMLSQGRNGTQYTERLRRFIIDNGFPLSDIKWGE